MFTLLEQVAGVAAGLGRGALLAKTDIESAYRIVPVHPQDRLLQEVQWRDRVYTVPMLPFRLQSAPKISTAEVDALEWHMRQKGVSHIHHYDFVVLGTPGYEQCAVALDTLHQECRLLGVPIAKHKTEGPATCLTFLGIVVNTAEFEL